MSLTIPLYALILTTLLPISLTTSSNSSYDVSESHLSQGSDTGIDSQEALTFHEVLLKVGSFVKNESLYNMQVLPHNANKSTNSKSNSNVTGTNVTIWANIIYVGDITAEMDFSVDMFLSQQWVDPRLNNLLPKSLSAIAIYGDLIDHFWIPMTIVRNGKRTIVPDDPSPNRVLKLFRNGTVSYKIRIETTCWCILDLSDYPFDNQTCQVIFEQFGHKTPDVQYNRYEHSVKNLFAPRCRYPNKFRLLFDNTSYESSSFKYDYKHKFSVFKIEFHFIREIGPIVIQSYLPACLIVVISWLGFYINRNSRFMLGVVLVMALSTLSFSSASRADNFGEITAKDIYTFSCFVFVFLSLVEYGLVHFLGNRYASMKSRQKKKKLSNDSQFIEPGRRRRRPLLERRVFSTTEYTAIDMEDLSALSVSLLPPDGETSETQGRALIDSPVRGSDSESSSVSGATGDDDSTRKMDAVFRCVLPVLFILFNIIYWAYFLHRYHVAKTGKTY